MDGENMIDNVRKHDILYDYRLKDYNNAKKRQQAWEEVAKSLHSTANECKNSWTKLRNAYTNAIKRRRSQSCQEGKRIQKWKFEDDMAFLIPFSEGRKASTNNRSTSQDSLENDEFENFEHNIKVDNTADFEDDKDAEIIDNYTSDSHINASSSNSLEQSHSRDPLQQNVFQAQKPTSTVTSNSKKRKKDKCVEDFVDIMEANTQLRSQIAALQQVNIAADETEMFYLCMARTIKKLPKQQQIHIRMKMCQLVSEAELLTYKSTSSPLKREKNIL